MKRYRIKNNGVKGFKVQERQCVFFWYDLKSCGSNYLIWTIIKFDTPEEAKDHIKDIIRKEKVNKKALKEAEYTEYV